MNKTVLFVLTCVFVVKCEHLILGDQNSTDMIYHTVAKYNTIPFIKRIKNVFYSNEEQAVINRILVYDNLHSKADASVTAGGVGYTFVNFRLNSERGNGLDYDIGLYS